MNSNTIKHMLRHKRDRTWFSHLLWHPASKRTGSILTTPEPTWGKPITKCQVYQSGACYSKGR